MLNLTVHFDSTRFGRVVINGKEYGDVLVLVDGTVMKRRAGIFRSHRVNSEEIKPILEGRPKNLIVGTGRWGLLRVTEEALKLASEHKVEVIELRTPEAIKKFNALPGKKAALVHVMC